MPLPDLLTRLPIPSATNSGVALKELQDSAKYMERILRHSFPSMDLGIESLRQKAEELEGAVVPESAECSGSDSERDLAIDDEQCTINAVDENIARTGIPISIHL